MYMILYLILSVSVNNVRTAQVFSWMSDNGVHCASITAVQCTPKCLTRSVHICRKNKHITYNTMGDSQLLYQLLTILFNNLRPETNNISARYSIHVILHVQWGSHSMPFVSPSINDGPLVQSIIQPATRQSTEHSHQQSITSPPHVVTVPLLSLVLSRHSPYSLVLDDGDVGSNV